MGASDIDLEIGAYLQRRELPRKLKKKLLGTRRQRRRFNMGFIRAMTAKKTYNITCHVVDLTVENRGQ
jgi:hypothetical protein